MDRLNAKLTFTNSQGKVTASVEINDLSKLDAAILQSRLLAGLKDVADEQINKESK